MSDIKKFRKGEFERAAMIIRENLTAILGILDGMQTSGKHVEELVEVTPTLIGGTGMQWVSFEAQRMRQQVTLAYVFGADAITMRPLP